MKGGRRTPVSVANEREGTSVAKQRRGQILPPQPNMRPAFEAGLFFCMVWFFLVFSDVNLLGELDGKGIVHKQKSTFIFIVVFVLLFFGLVYF